LRCNRQPVRAAPAYGNRQPVRDAPAYGNRQPVRAAPAYGRAGLSGFGGGVTGLASLMITFVAWRRPGTW